MPNDNSRAAILRRVERALWETMLLEATTSAGCSPSKERKKLLRDIEFYTDLQHEMKKSRYLNDSYKSTTTMSEYRDKFSKLDDKHMRKAVRMNKKKFKKVTKEISSYHEFSKKKKTGRKQRSVHDQLAITLERLAHDGTGTSAELLTLRWGVSVGAVSDYNTRVINALCELAPKYIYWPDETERQEIAQAIYERSGFPDCVGFIDGTHVILSQKPAIDGEVYINRKGSYSYNVQIVCDHRRKIRIIHTGWPGSKNDSGVFSQMRLSKEPDEFFRNESKEYIIGDGGYGLTERMLVPYRENHIGDDETKSQFNTGLARTRAVNENTIGVLKNRWRVLKNMHKQINKKGDSLPIGKTIIATAVLHNMMIEFNDLWPESAEDRDVNERSDKTTSNATT